MNEKKKRIVTPLQAIEKCRRYCAYQERSQEDVRKKLAGWEIDDETAEGIIAMLISENFISESRFVNAFVSGKFRILGWGRVKIRHALRFKKIPDRLISEALKTIDSGEYKSVLKKMLEKKNREIREKSILKRKQKLLRFAISRGFEPELAREMTESLLRD